MVRLAVVSTVLCGCGPQSHPDFSGTWVLDPGRSNYGRAERPSRGSVTIEHDDPLFRVRIETDTADGQNVVRVMNLVTGGAATIRVRTPEAREVETEAQTTWQRDAVVVGYSLKHAGHIDRFTETWRLSSDGRALTHRRDMEMPDRLGRRSTHRVEESYFR